MKTYEKRTEPEVKVVRNLNVMQLFMKENKWKINRETIIKLVWLRKIQYSVQYESKRSIRALITSVYFKATEIITVSLG